jgi:formyltetrahydrofolate-dependent phosphoribosylglycinamide formyltransferase
MPHPEDIRRLVVLISGSGTNLQAILDAQAAGELPIAVKLVVSNRKSAYGLVRAAQAGVPTVYYPLKACAEAGRSREAYDADLADRLAIFSPHLVVLAGWMHVLSPAFLNRLPCPVINLHPALPGAFPGTHAIQKAFEAYQHGQIDHSGCMVHTVVPEVDAGPVIAQAVVPFEPGDTLESFEARMHTTEHRLIIDAIRIAIR